jgi:hypothetical protein
MQAIVAKLLAPLPGARYDSARGIREDLERVTAGNQTRAEQEGWPRPADEDATRRTRPAADDSTRRTRPLASEPPPIPVPTPVAGIGGGINTATSAPQTTTAPIPTRQRPAAGRSRRLLKGALLLIAMAIVGNEFSVANDGRRAAGAVAVRELDQLAAAWQEYDALSERSHLRLGTSRLERSLVERTLVLADRVIANYRTPSPTVRERQWQLARDALARAIAVEGDDEALHARLRYCEGHLHRINGEAHKARDDAEDAKQELTDAVLAFREAAELRPNWPDPFLGLARTFTLGLEDVDRGADALNQAMKHGHTPSERETAQLADGYRARGNTFVRNAAALSGLPQERDYLIRAAEAYRQALALYSSAGGFTNVPSNIRLAQRALSRVEERLGVPADVTRDQAPVTDPAPAIETTLPEGVP